MRKHIIYHLLLMFIFCNKSFAYLSYGDGTDNCDFTGQATPLTKAVWNCNDLIIPGAVTLTFNALVTSPIQFRVQGNATIDGTINISASGSTGGPGGGNGGTCTGSPCTGSSGTGNTPGSGGTPGGDGALNNGTGGGGGGAGFLSTGSPSAGGPGTGSPAGSGGAAGTGTVTSASLSSSLVGGSGGGAGGSGFDFATSTYGSGGAGGGGGGSIAIIVKGDLNITGSINVSGDVGAQAPNPAPGSSYGGNGGSGSGGAIYLIVNGALNANTATVNIAGGGGTVTGANSNGDGGAGSVGVFRVDAKTTTNGDFGATTPDTSQTFPPSIADPVTSGGSSSDITEYESDIAAACTYKELHESSMRNFILSFVIGIFAMGLFKLNKFRW